jgi:hypothetical protein
MLAGMGAQGTGGKAGTQWEVGFKQGEQQGWGFTTMDKEPPFQGRFFFFNA